MSLLDKINPALSRRHFLIGASLTASGLLIGVRPSLAADAPPLQSRRSCDQFIEACGRFVVKHQRTRRRCRQAEEGRLVAKTGVSLMPSRH